MKVTLMAHTQLADSFQHKLILDAADNDIGRLFTDGQAIALTAIRTCYSANKPTDIVAKEGQKYFGQKATDGGPGSEADRLFRHITGSGHTSTLEHISFTFAVEKISRALLAQLTRHRVGFSFSVQSQRYVRLGSGDRSGGADFVLPVKIEAAGEDALQVWDDFMAECQRIYDTLRDLGIPAEDARAVLPNATACNLVMTANLTALIGFYGKRRPGNGAQAEIAQLAENVRLAVVEVEPWADPYFEAAGKKADQ